MVRSFKPFKVMREIDTEGFGDIGMRMADLDGDGALEAVFFQAADYDAPRISAGGYPHEKQVHCITAIKLDGKVLWQHGTPMGFGFWKQHGIAAEVADVNADGRPEVIYVTERNGRNYLRLLDGRTGLFLKEVETGANCVLQLCDIRGLGRRRDILVSTFLNPIYIYTDDLEVLWNCHFYGGAGHHHDFYDIDGDGKEELFIGYNCVRADGTKIWSRPDLEPRLEEMKRCPHVDDLKVIDLDGDGRMELLIIGGKDLICLDAATGKDKWVFEGIHLQWATVGDFIPGINGLEIYVTDKITGRSYLLDSAGHMIWQRDDLGYGQRILVRGIEEDCILISRLALGQQRLLIINGEGEILQEIPLLPSAKESLGYNLPPDRGIHFHIIARDVNADGSDEIIVFNRRRLLLFNQS